MALFSSSDAAALVRGAYDSDYAGSIWACQMALLGEEWRDGGADGGSSSRAGMPAATSGAAWPHAPDVWLSEGREGEARRLLVNAFSHLAKVRSSLVLPRYPDAPEPVEAARRAYFEARATEGDWDAAFDHAFFHGDALGVGFVRLGLEDDGEHQRLVAEPIHPLRVLWERTEANPTKSPWRAYSILMPLREAVGRFGRERAESAVEGELGSQTVRVIEYWDTGLGGHAPTHIVWLGDVAEGTEPVVRKANAFGVVPDACYVHLLAPGMRRPIGRVSMQIATAARLALLDEMIRVVAEQPAMTAIDRSLLEADVAKGMERGVFPSRFLFDSASSLDGVRAPIVRIPAGELNPILFQERQELRAQLDAESGVNDYDRGAFAQGTRTATEVELLNQRTGAVAAWPVKQLGKFYQAFYSVGEAIAARFDTAPLTVGVAGADLVLNDPGDPDLSLTEAFEDAGRITIEEESLFSGGVQRKRAEMSQSLESLMPLAQAGVIDLRKLTERILAARGFEADLLTPPAPAVPPVPAPVAPGVAPAVPPGMPVGLPGM